MRPTIWFLPACMLAPLAQAQNYTHAVSGLPDAAFPLLELSSAGSLDPPRHLAAIAGRAEVGLEWELVEGAESYEVLWSTERDPRPSSGERIEGVQPGFVHRELEAGVEVHYRIVARSAAESSTPSRKVSATPGGAYGLWRLGTGRIVDCAEGGVVDVPIERRIHTVVCAEGYLEEELAAGVFDRDVESWEQNVFTLWPYDELREAFVVWTLAIPSPEHVSATSPQEADTAFLVPLTADGRGIHSSVPLGGDTAERVWGALADFPFPPEEFYPRGGRTSLIAKNLLVALLVLDPARGRSGLSGRSRRLENPRDSAERISTAIANDRVHELSHALARLNDEYLDHAQENGADLQRKPNSSTISNVVKDPSEELLPWRHLLAGGEINPDVEGLVGAFGDPRIGYHSEFKCLMNGTHDNADFYGGRGNLRVRRFCNFCRELMFLRVYERVGILDNTRRSFATWTDRYRGPFYERYGFAVPDVVPQQNSDGEPVFQDCER